MSKRLQGPKFQGRPRRDGSSQGSLRVYVDPKGTFSTQREWVELRH